MSLVVDMHGKEKTHVLLVEEMIELTKEVETDFQSKTLSYKSCLSVAPPNKTHAGQMSVRCISDLETCTGPLNNQTGLLSVLPPDSVGLPSHWVVELVSLLQLLTCHTVLFV